MNINEHIEDIILDICESTSLLDAANLFIENIDILKEYKFIISSKFGTQMGLAINKKFSTGAEIRSLFDSEYVWVLDEKTAREMIENGVSHFPIDYSISLDTMSLSYIEPYINKGSAPASFKEVFDFISNDNVNIDPLVYQAENLENLDSDYSRNKIYKKIKAYEFLRNFDSESYLNKGVISSTISEIELEIRAQNLISKMLYSNENGYLKSEMSTLFNSISSYLFKILLIQKEMRNKSLESKLLALIEFAHNDMAFFCVREMLIAKRYFEEGSNFPFFNPIQPNNPTLMRDINGMTWDLFHVRYLELFLTIKDDGNFRYFFPAILTFDKRYIDLLKMNSIKIAIINTKKNKIQPVYSLDFYQEYSSVSQLIKEKIDFYFSDIMRDKRLSMHKNSKNNEIDYREIAIQLKKEFMKIFSINQAV